MAVEIARVTGWEREPATKRDGSPMTATVVTIHEPDGSVILDVFGGGCSAHVTFTAEQWRNLDTPTAEEADARLAWLAEAMVRAGDEQQHASEAAIEAAIAAGEQAARQS